MWGCIGLAVVRVVADNLADASGAGVHYNVAVLVADGTCAACVEGASIAGV